MARSFWPGWLFLVPLTLLAQEPALPVPPNVFVDGVPAIPLKLVSAVSPNGQFRRAQFVAWHPTERRLVVTTTFASVPQLHEVKFPGAADAVDLLPGRCVAPPRCGVPGARRGDCVPERYRRSQRAVRRSLGSED